MKNKKKKNRKTASPETVEWARRYLPMVSLRAAVASMEDAMIRLWRNDMDVEAKKGMEQLVEVITTLLTSFQVFHGNEGIEDLLEEWKPFTGWDKVDFKRKSDLERIGKRKQEMCTKEIVVREAKRILEMQRGFDNSTQWTASHVVSTNRDGLLSDSDPYWELAAVAMGLDKHRRSFLAVRPSRS